MKKILVTLCLMGIFTGSTTWAGNQYFSQLSSTGTAISGTKNINLVSLSNGTTTPITVDLVATGLATNTKLRTVTVPASSTVTTHMNDKAVTGFSIVTSTNSLPTDSTHLAADADYR